jgi:hypothetical protein
MSGKSPRGDTPSADGPHPRQRLLRLGGIIDQFPDDRCTPRDMDFGCIDEMRHYCDYDVTT